MSTLLYNMNYAKAHAIGQTEVYEKVYSATKDANYALSVAVDNAEMLEMNDPSAWRAATKIDYDGARSHLWQD